MEEPPRGVALLGKRLSRFCSAESRSKGVEFLPDSGDVIITTSPKCGTTWMQHIVHGLRTGGDLNFQEISCEVPWLELAHDLGIDLAAPQVPPRAFKSHLSYWNVPKGCKKITVVRDPHKVALSFYHFFKGWMFEPHEIDLVTFVTNFWLKRGKPTDKYGACGYWHFLLSFWEHKDDPDVLFVFFEDMQEDLAGAVQQVADFIGVGGGDGALQEKVVRQSTLAFMQEHGHLFDENVAKELLNPRIGVECKLPGAGCKVRHPGQVREELTEELARAIDARWAEIIGAELGYQSYQELREAFHTARAAK